MLDVPKLGLELLNNALTHCAATSESSEEYEECEALIEGLKVLVAPSPLKLGLMATSKGSADHVRREKDVQRSLMEVLEVRRMAL